MSTLRGVFTHLQDKYQLYEAFLKVPFTNCDTVEHNFGKFQLYEGKVSAWRGNLLESARPQGGVLQGLLWNHRALGCLEGWSHLELKSMILYCKN